MEKKFFNSDTRVFAHRGVPYEYPENTLLSFRRAFELGVDVIETDVHFTKDRRFVVIHDASLGRSTNGSGNVRDLTFEELKQIDAGYNFTRDNGKTYPFRDKSINPIFLEELLEEFPDQRFNIDLKEKNPEQIDYYADIIKKFNAENRILTASEHGVNLREIRKQFPDMATSFSSWEVINYYFLLKSGFLFLKDKFQGDALQVPEYYFGLRIVTSSFVKQAHAKGIKVHVWTINKESDMKRLLDIGVDGLFSDDPVLLMNILGK